MAQERSLRLGVDSTGAKQGSREVVRSLEDIRRAANRTVDEIDKVEKGFRGLNRAADALRGVGQKLTMFVTLPLAGLGGLAIKAAADMESLTKALDAMTGNSAETARQMERLKVVAAAPGLGFKEAVQGSVNLQAVGFAAQDAERALMAFGNAIATTGGGKGELDRVMFQLTQMAATGKIVAQDLKPIIQTAPAVAKALQELFGTTSAEAISKQVGSFEEFFNLLIPKLEEMPSVAGGAKNALDNLSDSTFRAAAALGDQLLPAVVPLIARLADALERTESLNPATFRSAIAFGAVAAVLGPLTLGLASLTTAVSSLGVALGTGLLPLIITGGSVVVALGILGKRWTENKLEALAAAGAVDQFRASLKGMGRDALILEVAGIQGRQEALRAEREHLVSSGTGTPSALLKIDLELQKLEFRAEEAAKRFSGFSDTVRDRVAPALDDGREKLTDFQRAIKALNEDLFMMNTGLYELQQITKGLRLPDVETRPASARTRPGEPASGILQDRARRERDRLRGFTGPLHLSEAKEEQDMARAFAEGARGLVDLADAAGALGDTSRRALSGLSGLIGGISGLKGQSGIGLAGGVLGLFGAGAQLISGLLGGNQGPSERERILEQNTDALSRLTLTMEGFRNTFDRQAAALTAARQIAGSEEARLGIAFGDKKRDREIVESFLAPLGLTFEQFSEIARQAGIELELASGNLNPDAFEQFAKALELARLNVQEFGATLEGQRKLADAYNEIFDVTDPAKLLESQVGLLAKQAPGLFGGFGNLDFASAGDRALLEAALRDMVTRAMSGALTANELGGFTSVDEFLQSILGIDRALDGFAEATNAATSAMLNVPRALPLELIRQGVYAGIAGRSGLGPGGPTDTGGNLPPGYGPVASRGAAWNIQGGVTVQVVSDGSETPEQLVRKIEQGVQQRAASGQYTYLPNTRTDR
jgi:tape measure domain-containing protein